VPERDDAAPLIGDVKEIKSPNGLDINPETPIPVRVSKRAVACAIGLGILLLVAFAYGGYRRQIRIRTETAQKDLRKNVSPASTAGTEFTKEIPAGNVPMSHRESLTAAAPPSIQELTPPTQLYAYGTGPVPVMAPANERVVIRHPPRPAPQPSTVQQPTEEERRLAAAYQREREAMLAPTAIRQSGSTWTGTRPVRGDTTTSSDDISRITALTQALTANAKKDPTAEMIQRAFSTGARQDDPSEGFEAQNAQARKEAFLNTLRTKQGDDYLRSTRVAPASQFEIKAGWEIPAILEQGLNSDLPGELKALVTSNVYDTATGLHLLIPQGARIIGTYDSRIAYGQDSVQVAWTRIIFPDASSVDLDGMAGLDIHGNSGLRDKVDRHYKRVFGMAVLSSLFAIAYELTQQRNRTVLTLPSPQETAGAAVGREIGQLGAQITRRNLNVQPTVKVSVGYRFTVRVNRDILFDAPYKPLQEGVERRSPLQAQR
jgi:type IV secretion system protein VirB10